MKSTSLQFTPCCCANTTASIIRIITVAASSKLARSTRRRQARHRQNCCDRLITTKSSTKYYSAFSLERETYKKIKHHVHEPIYPTCGELHCQRSSDQGLSKLKNFSEIRDSNGCVNKRGTGKRYKTVFDYSGRNSSEGSLEGQNWPAKTAIKRGSWFPFRIRERSKKRFGYLTPLVR